MAMTLTKAADGDVNIGSWNAEMVNATFAATDYPTGGYPVVDGVSVVNNPSLSANCDLYRVYGLIPLGGQGGLHLAFNPTTKKLQVYEQNATTGALVELPAATDISAYTFLLLLLGL